MPESNWDTEFNWAIMAEYFYNPTFKLPKRDVPTWIGKKFFGEEKHWASRLATVKDYIGKSNPKPKHILDLCCAGVYPSRDMARETDDRFVGLDINPASLEFAREQIREEGMDDRIELELGDILSMPFGDGTFDKTFCIGGVEYLEEPQLVQFLNEVKRVTKDQFVFTVTSTDAKRRFAYRVGLKDRFFKKHSIFYHKFYSEDELVDLIQRNGFEQPEIRKADYTLVASVRVPK